MTPGGDRPASGQISFARRNSTPISRYAEPPSQAHITTATRIEKITIIVHDKAKQAPDGHRDRVL